jgi:hypothetical protein
MKYLFRTILACILLSSCGRITFRSEGNNYIFRLPKWEYSKTYIDPHGYEEKYFYYPDSAIIFLSSNVSDGSEINKLKFEKYGNNISLKFLTQDTLTLEGYSNDKFWTELKKDKIIFGYLNVSHENKKKYDILIGGLFTEKTK